MYSPVSKLQKGSNKDGVDNPNKILKLRRE